MTIRAWLDSVGFAQYAPAFEAQEVSTDLLTDLDHETLKELGVGVLGHRLKILRAAKAGQSASNSVPEPVSGSRSAHVDAKSVWEAERRQLTIMFSDLVGSTSLSTRLDPEDYRDMLRLYHEAVAAAATAAGGHVAQFLGDGALIYFGYPAAQEDAAERAVNMGFSLIEAASHLEPFPGEPVRLRIGIATGLVVVGDIVGRGLDEGAVVSGETPNLAARLQGLAQPGSIVVSDTTHQLLGRGFRSEALVPQELKGFDGVQAIWRILGTTEVDDRFEAHRAAGLNPLVGRVEEMALLTERWQKAVDGTGSTVLLRGEAGLGKRRLLRELAERSEGATRAQLQASPYFANTSLHPVRRAVEQFAEFAREDTPEERLAKTLAFFEIDQAAPTDDAAILAEFMGLPTEGLPPIVVSIPMQRARLIASVIERIRLAAERAPVLFFFEDLQWVDPTSVEFMGKLIDVVPSCRVLIVATFRPEFELPWAEARHVTVRDMERMDEAGISQIISNLSGTMVLPEDVQRTLSERADGVPLFVEELTKSVIHAQGGNTELDAAAVPVTLLDTLMSRLDRLNTARRIAQMAAVIGREFPEELLAAISDSPVEDVRAGLDALAAAELIEPSEQAGIWAFHHGLIRDAAYDSLLRRSRQELHLKIAEAVGEIFPERSVTAPEFIARHYGEGGAAERASPHWLAAGRQARQRGAMQESLAHVLAGLEQVQRMPPSRQRDTLEMQLEMTHGYILFAGVGYASPEAFAAFARAGELTETVDDPDILTPFHNGYGTHLSMRGDIKGGHRELSKLVDVSRDNRHLGFYAAATQTWSNFNRGDFAASVEWGDRLKGMFEAGLWDPKGPRHTTGDPYVIGRCFHAASLWSVGLSDRASQVAADTLTYAKTLNDPFSEIYAQVNGVCRIADLRGESQKVLEVSSAAIDYAKRLGYDFAAGYSLFWQARALAETGDRGTALKIITASLAACKAASVRYHEPHFRAMLAVLQAEEGDLDGARATLDGLEVLVETSGERWQAVDVRCARAQVAELSGDTEAAERSWRDALSTARDLKAPSWELRAAVGLAGLLAEKKAGDEARDMLARLHGALSEGHETVDFRRAEKVLAAVI